MPRPAPPRRSFRALAAVFTLLVTTSLVAGTARAQAPGARPLYPVVFVHGLNASDATWRTVARTLEDLGWGEPSVLHAVLNADTASTHHLDDVVTTFPNVPALPDDGSAGSVFLVNFDATVGPDGTLRPDTRLDVPGQSESNQAAVAKQADALSHFVRVVLEATGEEKVVLVGHSLGGLAIREYLQRRDAAGTPRWWAAPEDPEGHRVALAVTVGTPHLGSDLGDGLGGVGPGGIQLRSEGVRDLRTTHGGGPGRFLFGGAEDLTGYYNTDLNADGDEADRVDGLNAGTADNPLLPLPADVHYAWVTSRGCGVLCAFAGFEGDGVVEWSRQWIYEADGTRRVPAPRGRAELLVTDVFHLEEPGDVGTILRALDESDDRETAYVLPLDRPEGVRLIAQRPSGEAADAGADADVLRLPAEGPGTVTLSLSAETAVPWRLAILGDAGVLLTDAGEAAGREERVSFGLAGSLTPRFVEAALSLPSEVLAAPYDLAAAFRPLQRLGCDPDASGTGMTLRLLPEAGDALGEGDEVGVFTEAGRCVGAGAWAGARLLVAVSGDDPQTDAVEGVRAGERLVLRRAGPGGTVRLPDARYARAGTATEALTFEAGAVYDVVELGSGVPVAAEAPPRPRALTLEAYPSPAAERVVVAYDLPSSASVRVVVYDIWGREVEVLESTARAAGRYAVTWDCRTRAPGLYLVRLHADGVSAATTVLVR